MHVRLISKNGGTALCAYAAAKCTRTKNHVAALRHAIQGGHESVLEHATYTFDVDGVSRALLAQVTRHRVASFSVESQRYVDLEDIYEYVTPHRIEDLGEEAVKRYQTQMSMMHDWYVEWVQALGGDLKAREDARFVLPAATTTSYVLTMNARELRHFFALRLCTRAQWEIRELAEAMLKLVRDEDPELFEDAGPGCVRGHCPEARPCGHPKEAVKR